MNILRRKGTKLDGKNPMLLTAYGGYGISLSPAFSARRRLWLDHGGVWVMANLRGGAEFGETWHEQGRLTKKQNVFDDFIACAEYLIKSKYTSPDKLAIEGGSNGGLLMGAALTQRPDLFRAVVSHVGIYDMLRVETFPNGAFNVTEFGTVKETRSVSGAVRVLAVPSCEGWDGLSGGSVSDRRQRWPRGSHEFAQDDGALAGRDALDSADPSAHQFRLGTRIGTALNERIEQDADVFAFLFDQLDEVALHASLGRPGASGLKSRLRMTDKI